VVEIIMEIPLLEEAVEVITAEVVAGFDKGLTSPYINI
jgi:hypothetical protein